MALALIYLLLDIVGGKEGPPSLTTSQGSSSAPRNLPRVLLTCTALIPPSGTFPGWRVKGTEAWHLEGRAGTPLLPGKELKLGLIGEYRGICTQTGCR